MITLKNNKLLFLSIILIIIAMLCGISYFFINKKSDRDVLKSVDDLRNYTGIVYVGTNKCPDCKKFTELLDKVTTKNTNFKYKKIEMKEIKKEKNPKNIVEMINHIGVGNAIPIFVYVENGEVIRMLEFADFETFSEDKQELALKIFFEKALNKE